MNELINNGYIILPSSIDNYQANKINFNTSDNTVDVKSVKMYIESYFMPKIKGTLQLPNDIVYSKFRYSNNNNSIDAATFHNDVYNCSNLDIIPVYTCLSYFDEAQMELIPRSHNKKNRTLTKCISNYSSKTVLNIPANSILIFNAGIFHRGKGFTPNKQRRLLQVFECFLNKNDYNTYHKNVYMVKINNSLTSKYINNINKQIAKNDITLNIFVFVHYIIEYYDLKYKLYPLDLSPLEKRGNFISYEPGESKKYDELNNEYVMPTNINIICYDWITTKNPGHFYKGVYLILLLFIIACCLFNTNTKTKAKTGTKRLRRKKR